MVMFPKLKRSERKRDYALYTDEMRSSVVYHWLFTRYGFRKLDEICLGLDSNSSHGYQSMGIAHYLGLTQDHHGYFQQCPFSLALSTLLEHLSEDSAYSLLYCYVRDWLLSHPSEERIPPMMLKEQDPDYRTDRVEASYWIAETLLQKSRKETVDEKLLSMISADDRTQSVKLGRRTYYYSKTSLKEAVKCLYDYQCQVCGARVYRPGWVQSLSRTEQWKFLNADAHHILSLHEEGPDRMENLLSLCPTCHRRFHTQQFTLRSNGIALGCEDTVLNHSWEISVKHPIQLFSS
ncbi:MAG: HNH endonuclease [Sphaerochaeta sp.]|nr:HNH endonuclease [Sphaerochaeta sp.]